MGTPIEDIKKSARSYDTPGTSNQNDALPNAIQDNTGTYVVSQQGSLEDQRPYVQLQAMLGDVLVMLHSAANQSSKPRCIEITKTAANYIKRIHRIHRSLFKAGAADPQYPRTPCQLIEIKGYVRDVLKQAGERLTLNKSLTQFLTLHGIKEIIKEPTELIAEAHRAVANFIEEGIEGGDSK
jgi:hypothetical protein